jgi:hypothetical protein
VNDESVEPVPGAGGGREPELGPVEPEWDPADRDHVDQLPATQKRGGSGRRRAALVVGVAVVVVLALVGGLIWLLGRDDGDGTVSGPDAADAFVDVYTRSLDATYRIEGQLTRTLEDGRTLQSGYHSVQRPPDRIQRALGSTSGEIGGRTVNCSTSDGGSYTCAAAGDAKPWPEQRQEILDALEVYVRGDDPVYEVTREESGCFDLVRRRTEEDASFGQRARLCFDDHYAGYRRLEVHHDGGAVDVMLADLVTDQVSDADFDLTANATYDPEVPDTGTAPATTA